jgi:hypothetical protein
MFTVMLQKALKGAGLVNTVIKICSHVIVRA